MGCSPQLRLRSEALRLVLELWPRADGQNPAVAGGLTRPSPTKANSDAGEKKNGGRSFRACRRFQFELWICALAFGYRVGILAQEIESGGFLGR